MNGLRAVIINKLNNNEGVGLMTKNMPFSVTLHPGTYYWCSCGKSAKEQFCDGSHIPQRNRQGAGGIRHQEDGAGRFVRVPAHKEPALL